MIMASGDKITHGTPGLDNVNSTVIVNVNLSILVGALYWIMFIFKDFWMVKHVNGEGTLEHLFIFTEA